MLTPEQVIDSEYLESRCALLEIAAVFDRYEMALERSSAAVGNVDKLECLRKALKLIAETDETSNRAEQLLKLFATV